MMKNAGSGQEKQAAADESGRALAGLFRVLDEHGNGGGDFFTGQGWKWKEKKENDTNHCSYTTCANDQGMRTCPMKGTQMAGC